MNRRDFLRGCAAAVAAGGAIGVAPDYGALARMLAGAAEAFKSRQ